MITFFLILASVLPVAFWLSVFAYMHLYGVSFKAAFICVYRAWLEPL